ncbi:DNA-directed RNA polymerase III subunit RPC6 [Golovinomyces cichoracearum]|uniref:DNA-directed RNA polymerase III subunit RPC6 n=1 Tax=Golovinomyces cichoracearum TaxID=62708 RepID=A0A420J774_9PEZI|nr:DNA-directed RNA polymerase III subunit RPC6 [Golovinomyces cichoracearum]
MSDVKSKSKNISALKNKLYDACLIIQEEDSEHIFRQNELQEFDKTSFENDILTLLSVVQELLDDKLLKVVNDSEGMGWKLRSREEAKKYRVLSAEQELVYAQIDESGQEGIWTKTIKARTNLHDAVFASCIKTLTSKGYICEMKSVEHPTRKMYIRASLRPSEKVTGGPWFTDGELDDVFINTALMLLHRHIHDHSWHKSRSNGIERRPKKKLKGTKPEEIKTVRKSEIEQITSNHVEYLPMPAGHDRYMTLEQLTLKIEESSVFNQTLSPSEVQQLLDVLVFDNKVERVMCGTKWGYRSLKHMTVSEDQRGGVISEFPCGRCPVFELCEEGGPIEPSSCLYLNEWLAL